MDELIHNCGSDSIFTRRIIGLIFTPNDLPLVYTLCPGRGEPDTVKLGDNIANTKLNTFLPNLTIRFDLYVKPFSCQCRT